MLETRIYQKQNSKGFFKLLKESLYDMYASRFLARQLSVRDIKAAYRQSYLGIIWAFLTPLATAVVWILLNASGTIQITDTGIPYPIFALSGTLIWSIMSEAIKAPLQTTNAAKGIMSKINFPKEALVISGVYKLLFNSSVKVLILISFVFILGVGFHTSLLFFPLVLLGAIFFGTTIGLFITPIGMLYKDVTKIITLGLQFLMYATPVVYSIPKEGIIKELMELNPITYIILTARDSIVGNEMNHLDSFFLVVGLCVPLFLVGIVFYRISIPIIVERLSA